MSNSAIITTKEKCLAVYLHWDGGRDAIEPLLEYCRLQEYCPPSVDGTGWARLCQVAGNYFGSSPSIKIDIYERLRGQSDNGTYIIDGWEIVGREDLHDGFVERDVYDTIEMLRAFDRSMPRDERLEGYLDAIEVPVSTLRKGDIVWLSNELFEHETYLVAGFGTGTVNGINYAGVPYVNRYGNSGEYSSNPDNYITSGTALLKRRHHHL